jgi:FtsP/CotA-like multicopper oxidase with cupredoxin domain
MRSARILGDYSVLPQALARREFLIGAGAAGMALAARSTVPARAQSATDKSDYAPRITPVSLELAPGKVIKTFGYNGTAPGPVLRLPEGRQVSFEISNETGRLE